MTYFWVFVFLLLAAQYESLVLPLAVIMIVPMCLLAAILVVGLGASTAYLIPWSLLPDAIDVDPEKPAGLFSAFMVFVQKLCISLVLFSFGSLMTFSGYMPTMGISQPQGALVAIRLCMGLIPALLVVLGLVVMRRWPASPQRQLALEAP